VLSKHPNPTLSYYFEERIRLISNTTVVIRGLDDLITDIEPDGLFVIICRYIKSSQLKWIKKNRSALSGVAFFVDDDLASVFTSSEGSLLYRYNIARLGIWPLPRLNPLLSHVWVSTERLAKSFDSAGSQALVLPPLPGELPLLHDQLDPQPTGKIKMVYHATAIHRREHEFLVPVAAMALNRNPNLHLEVIADGSLAKAWRQKGIAPDQLSIKPSLRWDEYLSHTSRQVADIALVPLLEGKTNSCRSDTKRIDVARLRAAAIYSRCDIFDRCAMPDELHVANDPNEWISAITLLATDSVRRMASKKATHLSLEKMKSLARPNFPFSEAR